MTSIQCCHECKTRSVGCHSACESYLALRARRDAELEDKIRENEEIYQAYVARKRANRLETDRRYREKQKRERETK